MKCNKCKQEMRIGTEQVGVDECGLPLFHRHAYCDNCMIKIDLDILRKTGDSVLSIIACVFSGVAFIMPLPVIVSVPMFFIGFILALIDLGINEKTKRHLGSNVAIILSILGFIVFGIKTF